MNWNELFDYDDVTGNLIWKPRSDTSKANRVFNTKFAGKIAGSKAYADNGDPRGISIGIRVDSGRVYEYAHRIISEMFDGPIPEGIQIDHADRNPFNNRRENHRRATIEQNRHNSRITARNKCGIKGVYLDAARGLWCAEIRSNGKRICLGRYATKGLAGVASAKAALRHHGEFARFA